MLKTTEPPPLQTPMIQKPQPLISHSLSCKKAWKSNIEEAFLKEEFPLVRNYHCRRRGRGGLTAPAQRALPLNIAAEAWKGVAQDRASNIYQAAAMNESIQCINAGRHTITRHIDVTHTHTHTHTQTSLDSPPFSSITYILSCTKPPI